MKNILLFIAFFCITSTIEAKKKYPDAYLVCFTSGLDKVRTIEEVIALRDKHFPELCIDLKEYLKKEPCFEAGSSSQYFYVEVKSLVKVKRNGELKLKRKKV